MDQLSLDLAALCRLALSRDRHPHCEVCSGPSRGHALCGACATLALRALARKHLTDFPTDHWDGAEAEWDEAETRLAGTRIARPTATTVAPDGLVQALRAAAA